jgi:hypothetical protein
MEEVLIGQVYVNNKDIACKYGIVLRTNSRTISGNELIKDITVYEDGTHQMMWFDEDLNYMLVEDDDSLEFCTSIGRLINPYRKENGLWAYIYENKKISGKICDVNEAGVIRRLEEIINKPKDSPEATEEKPKLFGMEVIIDENVEGVEIRKPKN